MRISFEFTDGSKAEIEGDEIAGVELLHCGASASDGESAGMNSGKTRFKVSREPITDGDRWELADLKAFGAQASEAFAPESSATEAPPASEPSATDSPASDPTSEPYGPDSPTVVP